MASTGRLRANITVIQKARHSSVITLMFLIRVTQWAENYVQREKIVLDTSEPLKLYYLEPWQRSS